MKQTFGKTPRTHKISGGPLAFPACVSGKIHNPKKGARHLAKPSVYFFTVILVQVLVSVSGTGYAQVENTSPASDPALRTNGPIKRYLVDGKIMSTKLVHAVQPVYPLKAKKKRIQGTARLHAIIAADGSVKELSLLSGDPILAKSAVAAVKQWRYEQTLINNEPGEVDTVVVVVFELPK